MSDKQNPAEVSERMLPAEDGRSWPEKSEETPRSYYYDDATGYEIYKDEDSVEPDEPDDSAEDES